MLIRTILLIGTVLSHLSINAQEEINQDTTGRISSKYTTGISEQARSIDERLDKHTEKALASFQKQEARLQRKLAKLDAAKAQQVFGNNKQEYARLKGQVEKLTQGSPYIPSLDTLVTSLQFLKQNPQLLSQAKGASEKLDASLAKMRGLQGKFQKAEEVKRFLKERRQYLKDQLMGLGFAREFRHLNKQVYYYSRRLNECKELLKDHKKAERKALELLSQTKLFKDFMRKNSQLASMFRMPGSPNDPLSQAGLAGLQTRAQVSAFIQQQVSAGGPNAQAAIQQNLQQAQSQLNQLKSRITQMGGSSSDDIIPEGFRPNNQKTKSFLQRLELGTNIQSQKANGYFPTTSDLGVSLGYKINDKSIVGVGASYKMGWGRDLRNINITHQGVGMRSFVEWKIKGSFWLGGGFEMNYRNEYNRVDVLKDFSAWQQSGLVGVSKVVSLKTKFFKQTKLQLLWDFLSYEQIPQTQSVVFRVGYSFK